jgi:hypothetical protein
MLLPGWRSMIHVVFLAASNKWAQLNSKARGKLVNKEARNSNSGNRYSRVGTKVLIAAADGERVASAAGMPRNVGMARNVCVGIRLIPAHPSPVKF